jgi:hypothetical protein
MHNCVWSFHALEGMEYAGQLRVSCVIEDRRYGCGYAEKAKENFVSSDRGMICREHILRLFTVAAIMPAVFENGCTSGERQSVPQILLRHVLFVGDSFAHGRYLPVRH